MRDSKTQSTDKNTYSLPVVTVLTVLSSSSSPSPYPATSLPKLFYLEGSFPAATQLSPGRIVFVPIAEHRYVHRVPLGVCTRILFCSNMAHGSVDLALPYMKSDT